METLGVMSMFALAVMVAQVNKYVKTYQTVRFKYLQSNIAYQLCFSKTYF